MARRKLPRSSQQKARKVRKASNASRITVPIAAPTSMPSMFFSTVEDRISRRVVLRWLKFLCGKR